MNNAMDNLLLKKLQIKSGFKMAVINGPANFDEIIGPLTDVQFQKEVRHDIQALLIFATTKAALNQILAQHQAIFTDKLICWIIYPKAKTELAGDLNLMQSWEDLKYYELTPCASAAIDRTWTALRVKPIGEVKKSGLGNAEIKTSDYGEFIDVNAKTVKLPSALYDELSVQPTALANFEALSYSNKKEYVLWFLSAKQEKTKLERLQKTVEKLLSGKKNPSEK
ncbi:MAG: YdeI/OmpD-associated family protein [Pedobacter sp.]|nr:YdeI/OmpD-associated family protein [Pedobacter sp.]MDQ8051978.1 YdeI/OmpD-associated family protein [Pedobacter sp.]